ncbi:hypothetical protein CLOP_g13360 [Closterium sp. NIES-67]|nr:hypothetical protein CLOP_g13360 [Closterium sp. NIES-67]
MASAAPTTITSGGNLEGNLPLLKGPVQISGLKELVETGKYEAWILDQFGVLHDGKKAYPEAIEALRQLAASGAKVVLLSNSSRRVDVASKKLPSLGFDPSLFCGIVTSGEITHRHLIDRSLGPFFETLGSKCLHFTWAARGAVSLEGLGLQVVEAPEEADFILAHGTEAVGLAQGPNTTGGTSTSQVHTEEDKPARPASLDELAELMRLAAEEGRRRGRMIPMVVANPDIVTVEERALRVMPGTLARQYEEMGGVVKCMGKPDPISFRAAQQLTGIPPDSTIMVGDSLHHDILGAASFGIDCVFVAGGYMQSNWGWHLQLGEGKAKGKGKGKGEGEEERWRGDTEMW